jgi:hypothetical protein
LSTKYVVKLGKNPKYGYRYLNTNVCIRRS